MRAAQDAQRAQDREAREAERQQRESERATHEAARTEEERAWVQAVKLVEPLGVYRIRKRRPGAIDQHLGERRHGKCDQECFPHGTTRRRSEVLRCRHGNPA